MKLSDEILKKYFSEKIFLKNEFLIKEGRKDDNIYYLESGIVRFVTNTFEEKEYTFDFGFSYDFVNSYRSYKYNVPSEYGIQAISIVKAHIINKETVDQVINENKDYMLLYIEVLEELLIKKIKREEMLLKNSPREIYKYLIEKEPYFIQNIPLKYIASYIGITPQALSRIRKKNLLTKVHCS